MVSVLSAQDKVSNGVSLTSKTVSIGDCPSNISAAYAIAKGP